MTTETFKSLVEQLRESTGQHMLDSGGAYGRGWQRWQGVGDLDAAIAAAEAKPSAWATDYGISVNAVKHLDSILEYVPDGDAAFAAWVEKDDEDLDAYSKHPWLVSAERFVAWLLTEDADATDVNIQTFNTCNEETLLDETIQYVNFDSDDIYETEVPGIELGEKYVLLQTHNGCDLRGGYGRPRLYKYKDQDSYINYTNVTFWHNVEVPQEEALDGMPEPLLTHSYTLYGAGSTWTDFDGDYIPNSEGPEWDEEKKALVCPLDGEPLEGSLDEY